MTSTRDDPPEGQGALAHLELDLLRGAVRASVNFNRVTGLSLDALDATGLRSRLAERMPADAWRRLGDCVAALRPEDPVARLGVTLTGDDGRARRLDAVIRLGWAGEGAATHAFVVLGLGSVDGDTRYSEARYGAALTAGRMGSWETDLVAGTRSWSKEGMALFGLSLPDGQGQVGGESDEYLGALHPDDRHLMGDYHALADRQDSFTAEYRIVRPGGETLWLSGRGLVVERGPDGRARRLVNVMAEITERKAAETALRIERERLTQALDASRMGAYDLSTRDGVLWWSPQTFEILGVDPQSFRPDVHNVLALVHEEDRDAFVKRRAEALRERRPFEHDYRVVRPDGVMAWVAHRGHAEYDADGRMVRSFGVIMDITARKQVEQELREADRKKDEFVATLAHELRNPLAPVRNAVEILRRVPHGNARVDWCRDVIERQVAQMAHLLDDLLDASRITRGQLLLRLAPLAMSAVVEQALEIAQPVIDAARHTLNVSLPPAPLVVQGDLTRLAQLFSNLLINAAKYTPEGGRIALAVEAQGAEVVVRVQDSGIGIAPEQMSQLFQMFGQVGSALERAQGGVGIGLWLAKGLVELHGGRIAARSDGRGHGSEFSVTLPLMSEVADERASPGEGSRGASATGRRILVVDDLRDSADSLQLMLESLGHEVRAAYGGEEGLRLAESWRPEVVLLDIGMPDLNGHDVCRRIRAQPWGTGMTIIAQTGWGKEDDRRRTQEAGFDHHVVKPIDAALLSSLLTQASAMRR